MDGSWTHERLCFSLALDTWRYFQPSERCGVENLEIYLNELHVSFRSRDEMIDTSASNKGCIIGISAHSLNAAPPPRSQRHGESRPVAVSLATHKSREILMDLEGQACTPTYGDSSSGFETDTTWSEDESNWDEDVPRIYDHLGLLARDMRSPEMSNQALLTPLKEKLVDSIMREFWIIFNQDWRTNLRKHPGGSSQSRSSPAAQRNHKPERASTSRRRKRGREDDGDGSSDDNNGRSPKRPKAYSSPPQELNERSKFACPYHKHDPQKYCHQNRRWRSCALTPLDTIARVK